MDPGEVKKDFTDPRVALQVVAGVSLEVGILDGTKTEEDGTRVVDIGAIHEFGLGNVPERSFLRGYFLEHRADVMEAARRLFKAYPPDQALELLGQWIVGQIQARITLRIPPPLKPETIKRKSKDGKVKDVPLIDGGILRSSISYVVKK